MRYFWIVVFCFISCSARAGYQGYIFVGSALTTPNISPAICSHYAAEHIKVLGFSISSQTEFAVNATRGNERVIYSCDFGTTYGGRGLLGMVYIPEDKDGYTVSGADQIWLQVKNPQLVLYGRAVR